MKVPISVRVSGNFVFICLKTRASEDIFHGTMRWCQERAAFTGVASVFG